MSDQHPSGSVSTTEELSTGFRPPKQAGGSGRRVIATVAAVALTGGAVAAGLAAWHAFADQGAQPAEALPSNTLAYAALDLDPPGGQKVEAFKTLRKFPSLKKELGLDSVDDVRESVVKQISSDTGCRLDYATFEPWVGDRVAFAVVAQAEPEAVVVVQVGDSAKAENSLKATSSRCGFGYSVGDQWAVLARSTSVAAKVRSDAGQGTLAEDADYRRLTKAAGSAGLATLYAAPEAGKALLDASEDDPFVALAATQMISAGADPLNAFVGGFGIFFLTSSVLEAESDSDFASSSPGDSGAYEPKIPPQYQAEYDRIQQRFEHIEDLSDAEREKLFTDQGKLFEKLGPDAFEFEDEDGVDPDELGSEEEFPEDEFPTPELPAALRTTLKNFTGLGGVVRFDDGGLELSVVGDPLKGTSTDLYAGDDAGDLLADLPDDTAVAFGAGLSDGWVDAFITQLHQQFSFTGKSRAETVKSFEKATGLDLPGDLRALGGDGVSVVVGSGFSPDTLFEDPEEAPVAVRIQGDQGKVEAVLDKIRSKVGPDGTKIVSRRLGDSVVVGTNATYLDHLAKGGDLLGTDRFGQVAPDAKGATTVYYVNFDAGDWLTKAIGSSEDRKDAEPLGAAGMTVTRDGDQQRILYRLSFDD